MEQGYTERLMAYVNDSRRVGQIENADGTGETGLDGSAVGQRLAVRFTLRVERDQVAQIRFQVFGCGFTIAACSVAAELSEGQLLADVQKVDAVAVHRQLNHDLPDDRGYCADLAVQALQAAVRSALGDGSVVSVELKSEEDHGPRVCASDPLYLALLASTAPQGCDPEDRQLFASLITVATQEDCPMTAALGLNEEQLAALFATWFPYFDRRLVDGKQPILIAPPQINADVEDVLFSFVPADAEATSPAWLLAQILAARAAHKGHLWVAMGLLKRPQLTAAIRRHLPELAEANNKEMRWKRFLFKRVCDLGGGVMCKTPNCGDCSDFALCFVTDD